MSMCLFPVTNSTFHCSFVCKATKSCRFVGVMFSFSTHLGGSPPRSHFPGLFPKLAMSLFSRISVFFSGCSRVLETIALATLWMWMAMDVEQTEVRAPKNFLAIHSPGRFSCLSTNRTLLKRKTGESTGDLVFALGLIHICNWKQPDYTGNLTSYCISN